MPEPKKKYTVTIVLTDGDSNDRGGVVESEITFDPPVDSGVDPKSPAVYAALTMLESIKQNEI